jgi:hypothetical protein
MNAFCFLNVFVVYMYEIVKSVDSTAQGEEALVLLLEIRPFPRTTFVSL